MKHDRVILDSRGKIKKRSPRVTVPAFEIYSNPTVKIADVTRRRFNLIDRATQKARQQLMSQEDDKIFRALDDIINTDTIKE